jgi:hypothetical protein
MTWSSYPQHQLMVEGFRDFFKRKKKSSATYPATELTTIVNLISSLAKKFDIQTDTRAIIDEFEAMLKSQNIDLQEQDDRLMIGADLKLNLERAPKLKQFISTLKQKDPKALQPLVKALKKGAFDVGAIASSLGDTQSSDETAPAEPPAATPSTPEEEPDTPEPKQDGLKSLSRAEIKQALGPIKNFGKLDIKKVRQEIENNISKQLKGNPFAKKIKSEQLPNVMKILDQVEKILAGDFENLVSESDSKKLINLISEEIIKVINE